MHDTCRDLLLPASLASRGMRRCPFTIRPHLPPPHLPQPCPSCPVTRIPSSLPGPAAAHWAPHRCNQLSGPHGDGNQPDLTPSSLVSADAAAGLSSSGMGSASPSLSSLPPSRLLLSPGTVFRTGPEKVAAGVVRPERQDWSPSPPATPEQGLSAFYLSYLDTLYPEDSHWAAKGSGVSTQDKPPEEPEQCPVIDSQAPGGSLDLVPGGLALEEHSLEQVQSMVVGEVLKDIETACKLLNITAGESLRTSTSARWGQAGLGGAEVVGAGGGGGERPAALWPALPSLKQPQTSWCFPPHGHIAGSRGWDAGTLRVPHLHHPSPCWVK